MPSDTLKSTLKLPYFQKLSWGFATPLPELIWLAALAYFVIHHVSLDPPPAKNPGSAPDIGICLHICMYLRMCVFACVGVCKHVCAYCVCA